MSQAYLLAWVIACGADSACLFAATTPRTPGRAGMALGYGSVAGMLLAAAFSALAGRADTAHAASAAAPWLAAIGVGAALIAMYRLRALGPRVPVPEENVDYWKNIIVALALASLVWRGSLLGSEVLLRPIYPWDAWDAWAVKSKTWFLLGHYVPFVAPEQWLRDGGADLHSGPAWAYPSAVAWLQVYFASAAGDWIEPLVNVPWLVLWVGLLLGHHGQWRALGLGPTRATVAVYALGSLPLLNTHVALAGYADLWVATVFGFAWLAWLRWQERRERHQLVIAIACAGALPLLKFEGMIWCLSLLATMAIGVLPRRWRWRVALAGAGLLLVLALLGETRVLFAALGWIRSGSHVAEIPVIGKLALAWHGDAALGIVRSLLLQLNWHLLWWLAVPLIIWRWRVLRASDALSLGALLLLFAFSVLVFLFVFTDAAEWAESYTAVNRLIMQITPALVSLLALLLRGETAGFPGTAPERARPNAAA